VGGIVGGGGWKEGGGAPIETRAVGEQGGEEVVGEGGEDDSDAGSEEAEVLRF